MIGAGTYNGCEADRGRCECELTLWGAFMKGAIGLATSAARNTSPKVSNRVVGGGEDFVEPCLRLRLLAENSQLGRMRDCNKISWLTGMLFIGFPDSPRQFMFAKCGGSLEFRRHRVVLALTRFEVRVDIQGCIFGTEWNPREKCCVCSRLFRRELSEQTKSKNCHKG